VWNVYVGRTGFSPEERQKKRRDPPHDLANLYGPPRSSARRNAGRVSNRSLKRTRLGYSASGPRIALASTAKESWMSAAEIWRRWCRPRGA